MNFVPKMDSTRLIEGYRSILRTIYHPSEYYRRALESIKRISDAGPEQSNHTIISSVVALSRIILRLGIIDRERREFWGFVRHVIADHREMFADSMRLAAMGYHFRRIVESL